MPVLPSPAAVNPPQQITNLPNSVDFRAVFGRRKDYLAAGLTYTVQFSAGLDIWQQHRHAHVLASDAEIDAVSVPYPLFIPTSRGVEKPKFFRVRVNTTLERDPATVIHRRLPHLRNTNLEAI